MLSSTKCMHAQVQLIDQLDSKFIYKLARMAGSCCNGMDSVDQINLCFLKKHGVAMKTFCKWSADNDKTPNTTGGFNYHKADREHMATLSCFQFVSSIMVSCCVIHSIALLM